MSARFRRDPSSEQLRQSLLRTHVLHLDVLKFLFRLDR
jgi:hypothetical protein